MVFTLRHLTALVTAKRRKINDSSQRVRRSGVRIALIQPNAPLLLIPGSRSSRSCCGGLGCRNRRRSRAGRGRSDGLRHRSRCSFWCGRRGRRSSRWGAGHRFLNPGCLRDRYGDSPRCTQLNTLSRDKINAGCDRDQSKTNFSSHVSTPFSHPIESGSGDIIAMGCTADKNRRDGRETSTASLLRAQFIRPPAQLFPGLRKFGRSVSAGDPGFAIPSSRSFSFRPRGRKTRTICSSSPRSASNPRGSRTPWFSINPRILCRPEGELPRWEEPIRLLF